jgi:two-component system nitrate/nitrite sensor histidine kinase NarX
MMKSVLRHSLPVQAWAAVFTISILCFISALGSGTLAWVSESDAQAINTAGSIRMAVYRINFQLAADFDNVEPSDRAIYLQQSNNAKETDALVRANKLHNAESATEDVIALTTLIVDMENRLEKLDTHLAISKRQHEAINNQFDIIKSQWSRHLKPLLLAQDKQTFYRDSLPYVIEVDKLVSELQYRSEQRQVWQQLSQLVFLLLIIIILLLGMYQLRQNVLTPVQRLIRANSQFQQGKRDTRVSIAGYSEFNDLGRSFNEMAATIDIYQRSLESEVQTKTQHLVKANQALSLLYDFSKHLTTSQVSLYTLDSLITDFGNILPHLDFTLCIQDKFINNKDSIALHSEKMQELCTKLTCDNCVITQNQYTKSYPIAHQTTEFGELRVRPKSILLATSVLMTAGHYHNNDNDGKHNYGDSNDNDNNKSRPASQRIPTLDKNNPYPDYENNELIIALTNLISTALSLRKQKQQEHQLILFEERTTIARELHDSLAQSLSYLKIQVSVLEKHLNKAFDQQSAESEGNVWEHIGQIKIGLKSAYQELRDLLITFRLTIDDNNFDEALHEAANEFAVRGKFQTVVDNSVMALNLNASEQINLIQIAREALSNISRHAQADNVVIKLGYDDENSHIVMAIADDGIGMSGPVDQSLHHGLMIMEERAHSLGGTLIVTNNEPQGTIIITKFRPDFFDKALLK